MEEIEEIVFQALAHPMRRSLLKILRSDPNGVSYTELVGELGLSTGKLNYHIEQLGGLIEKNSDRKYILTSLGRKAVNQMSLIEQGIEKEDEKYLHIAEKAKKTSLEPTLKSFLLIGIAGAIMIFVVLATLVYVAVSEANTPVLVFVLLPVFTALDVIIIVALIRAFRKAPAWLRRFERRFFAD